MGHSRGVEAKGLSSLRRFPGAEFRFVSLGDKCLYLLSHLLAPKYLVLRTYLEIEE